MEVRESSDNTTNLMKELKNAVKFEEDGLWGLMTIDGQVLLEAQYDKIEFCADFIYVHYGTRHKFFYNNGSTSDCPDREEDGRFYENGKIGLKDGGDNVIFPAEYDEIIDWGKDSDVIYVRSGKEYHYFNHNHEEILTDRTVIPEDAYPDCPYNPGEDQNRNVLLCIEPVAEISGEMVCFTCGQPVRISRIRRRNVRSMFRCCDIVPMTKDALDDFMNRNTYIYSARKCKSMADMPAADCIKRFESLECYDSSWSHLIRITSNRNTQLSSEDLYEVIKHFEDGESVIDYHIAVGHNDSLKDGEVEVLQIHYFRDDGPGFLDDDFIQEVLPDGSLQEVKNALADMKPTERQEQIKEAFWWVKYSENRDWVSTKEVLEYLDSQGCDNYGSILKGNIPINPFWIEELTPKVIEFRKRMIQWAIDKGANINAIHKGKSFLDECKSDVKDAHYYKDKEPEMKVYLERIEQFVKWLKTLGAVSTQTQRKRMKALVPTMSIIKLIKASKS